MGDLVGRPASPGPHHAAARADRRAHGEGGEARGRGGVAGELRRARPRPRPRIITDDWIDRAITRYGQFLDLARKDPGATLVPTLDIDLIWHVHMLSPRDYLCGNQPVS